MTDPIEAFRATLAQGSLSAGEIVPDGKIHRVKVEGDKGGERSGWYVFFPDNLPAGAFGNWRTGAREK